MPLWIYKLLISRNLKSQLYKMFQDISKSMEITNNKLRIKSDNLEITKKSNPEPLKL